MHHHRVQHIPLVRGRILLPLHLRLRQRIPSRKIPQHQIVRRRLIGKHIGNHTTLQQLRQHLCDIPQQPHRQRLSPRLRIQHHLQRLIQIRRFHITIPRPNPHIDMRLIYLQPQKRSPIHRGGQRLSASHPPETRRHHQLPLQRSAKMLPCALRKRLIRSLHNPLRANIDPRSGRHLPVHRKPHRIQPPKLIPRRPSRHQMRIRNQHPRRLLMRPKHSNRLPALHQQRFIILQPLQRTHNPMITLPIPRRLPPAAIHNQILRPFRHLRIQIIH